MPFDFCSFGAPTLMMSLLYTMSGHILPALMRVHTCCVHSDKYTLVLDV
jgi:hypothetical protein